MNCVTACQGPRAASSSCLAGTGAIVLCLRNSAALDSAQTQNGASRYTAQTHEAQMPGVGQQAPSWPNSPSQRPLLRFCLGGPSLLVVLGPRWPWSGPDGHTDDGDGSLDGSADGYSSDVHNAAPLPRTSHLQHLQSALTARPTSTTACQPPGAPKTMICRPTRSFVLPVQAACRDRRHL